MTQGVTTLALLEATYLPSHRRMFLWHRDLSTEPPTWPNTQPISVSLLLPLSTSELQQKEIRGIMLEAGDAAELLAAPPPLLRSPSAHFWGLASRALLDMISRGRFLPVSVPGKRQTSVQISWKLLFDQSSDRKRERMLSRNMPGACYCSLPDPDQAFLPEADTQDAEKKRAAVLKAFLADATDSLVRRAAPANRVLHGWEADLVEHLSEPPGYDLYLSSVHLAEEVLHWLREPKPQQSWTAVAQLTTPTKDTAQDEILSAEFLETATTPTTLPQDADTQDTLQWLLSFYLQSEDEPETLIPAAEVWEEGSEDQRLALEDLLEQLQTVLPKELSARTRKGKPSSLALDTAGAWAYIEASHRGFFTKNTSTELPDSLRLEEQTQLRLRLRADAGTTHAQSHDPFSDPEPFTSTWELLLGDILLSESDTRAITETTFPVLQLGNKWVTFDPVELNRVQERIKGPPPKMGPGEVIAAVLTGELSLDGIDTIEVVGTGEVARLAQILRLQEYGEQTVPPDFTGSLRPYQARGFAWLIWLDKNGFSGCLADDMGLGKTVQAIALMLHDTGPTLVVCPTSVLGNWEREINRFAPTLEVLRHHSPQRFADPESFIPAVTPRHIVLTTYTILRKDSKLLTQVHWRRVILDEAQNMKNPLTDTARAARAVGASANSRLALTGTPVENHLLDLWSILDFCNPGLLGNPTSFRQRFSVPIERNNDTATATRLRQITAPFLLRRRKSDPDIVPDLPDKHETTIFCNLTSEQADLYRTVAQAGMARVRSIDGMARRGQILALLTRLKQLCDHTSLVEKGKNAALALKKYGENGSGKLNTLLDLVAEVRQSGDRSLIFTQYVKMGHILSEALGKVPFFHGGLTQEKRDKLTLAFQNDPEGPDVFIVSLKAGGLGLDLSAANRVFHYDRWWNPAVEDQATDRAHRIGQTQDVWVHKLVCLGTLEERIDELLTRKRKLADHVLRPANNWVTELSNDELEALIALEERAVL